MRYLPAKLCADFLENKIKQNAVLIQDNSVESKTDSQGYDMVFGEIKGGFASPVAVDAYAAKISNKYAIVVVHNTGKSWSR